MTQDVYMGLGVVNRLAAAALEGVLDDSLVTRSGEKEGKRWVPARLEPMRGRPPWLESWRGDLNP